MERKLASIRKIEEIQPIEGADKIVKARIGGWWVVTAIDNGFKVGDLVVYLEIDSWVPDEIAPFLSKGAIPKQYNGIPGARLKTIRLRGQVSQGLILPVFSDESGFYIHHIDGNIQNVAEGQDVTEALGIQKWEAPVSGQLSGVTKGSFPSFIRKTDQERAQNLVWEIFEKNTEETYEVTMKLDGSSMTVYHRTFPVSSGIDVQMTITTGVCSRNQELKLDQEGNTFVDTAKKSGLIEALEKLGRNIAVQGELMGPGVQGNREGFTEHKFFLFDIFDIDNYRYLSPRERNGVFQQLVVLGANIEHVPVIHDSIRIGEFATNIADLIFKADGESLVNKVREGLVFKSHDSEFTWKVISNEFLLKGGN